MTNCCSHGTLLHFGLQSSHSLPKGNAVNIPQTGRGYCVVRPGVRIELLLGFSRVVSLAPDTAYGASETTLENPSKSSILTPGRTTNRIRSPRLAASGR